MKVANSTPPSATPVVARPAAKPAVDDTMRLPEETFKAHKDHPLLDITKFMTTKVGPMAALAGGLGALAQAHLGTAAAVAVVAGVPALAYTGMAIKDSLPHVFPQDGAGIGRAVISGASLVGGAVGAIAGVHFGSAVMGAAVGALAPGATALVLLGGLKLATTIAP